MSTQAIPTCKFFDPSTSLAENTGAVSSPDYPYNRHLRFSSCWCDARAIAENGQPAESAWIPCMIAEPGEFPSCSYYEPETPEKLRFVRLKNIVADEPEYRYIVLDRIRLLSGVAEYRIITWTSPSDEATLIPAEGWQIEAAINSTLNPTNYREVSAAVFEELIATHTTEATETLEYTLGEIVDADHSYLNLITAGA